MRSYTLPPHHYAASWKVDEESRLSNAEITELGRRYVLADGLEKEDLLLQLCRHFHPYLMKYLVMICRGHVPVWKGGVINSDASAFLGYFLGKGQKLDMVSARAIVTSLHLAFKGMDGAEVYDVLMATFLEAVAKYDPAYTEKVKRVVECIEHELLSRKQIHSGELRRHLDLDCDRYLRLLSRRGFLSAVKGKDGKISGWVRTGIWPPPEEFFTSGAIGFAYYVQTWFRYYLQQWIEGRLSELEAKDGVYNDTFLKGELRDKAGSRAGNNDGSFLREPKALDETVRPSNRIQGAPNFADVELYSRQMDLSRLNIEWVEKTEDPLFSELSKNERYLLYLHFNKGLKPKELASTFDTTPEEIKKDLDELIEKIRSLAILTISDTGQ